MIFTAGWVGGPEIIIILVVVLLLFGGKKIPELARGLGKGIRDFKNAAEDNDLAKDIKDVASEMKDIKDSVGKMHPKKMLDVDNPLSSKKNK